MADRKSIGGDLIYFGLTLVGSTCKAQSVVASSSQASEVYPGIQCIQAGKMASRDVGGNWSCNYVQAYTYADGFDERCVSYIINH